MIVFVIFSFMVFTGAECSIKDTILGGEKFGPKGDEKFDSTKITKDDVTTVVTNFAGIMAGAASTIALIFIIIGGIQYITSAGNQEQATKAKSTLTWALIGFILIIASYSIIKLFTEILTKK